MSNWAFFYKSESRHHHPHAGESKDITLELPEGTTLEQALAAARKAGMPKGSHRAGCFEVQAPHGIWYHKDGNRIDPAVMSSVAFETWEQWEARIEMEYAR